MTHVLLAALFAGLFMFLACMRTEHNWNSLLPASWKWAVLLPAKLGQGELYSTDRGALHWPLL